MVAFLVVTWEMHNHPDQLHQHCSNRGEDELLHLLHRHPVPNIAHVTHDMRHKSIGKFLCNPTRERDGTQFLRILRMLLCVLGDISGL